MRTVDARGQLCPKPVMMTREMTLLGTPEIRVLVDNEVSAANVARFLETSGYRVARSDDDGVIRLDGSREAGEGTQAEPERGAPQPAQADRAFLILSQYLGEHQDGLGEVLMKSFLGTVAQSTPYPAAIALMNDGVLLAMPDSTCSGTLREIESAGVPVLVCGTCTKHFGITEGIAVGKISNMFEITETIFGAARPIVLR